MLCHLLSPIKLTKGFSVDESQNNKKDCLNLCEAANCSQTIRAIKEKKAQQRILPGLEVYISVKLRSWKKSHKIN